MKRGNSWSKDDQTVGKSLIKIIPKHEIIGGLLL